MMRPQFNHWLGELCLYYSNPNWPTDVNVNAAFRDVQHMDGLALEFMGAFIRREYQHWPRSLSYAMHKAYDLWEKEQARKKAQDESCTVTPPSPERSAENRNRARDILAMLAGNNVRPPEWYTRQR